MALVNPGGHTVDEYEDDASDEGLLLEMRVNTLCKENRHVLFVRKPEPSVIKPMPEHLKCEDLHKKLFSCASQPPVSTWLDMVWRRARLIPFCGRYPRKRLGAGQQLLEQVKIGVLAIKLGSFT